MKCPKCGKEMILGTLQASREIVWRPPDFEHRFSGNHASVRLTKPSLESFFESSVSVESFHCPNCKLIITEY